MYNAEELITKKEEFAIVADSLVTATLGELNFIVEGVFLLADPSLPPAIQKQVEAKIAADQIAQMKQSELKQAQADAAKVVATAKGRADADVIQAEADARVYLLQTRNLSPAILDKMYIEKWDGTYGTGNVFGAGTNIMKNLK
jgi:regulator of protease activity HflC (stomatin/prohibitin superfamily)